MTQNQLSGLANKGVYCVLSASSPRALSKNLSGVTQPDVCDLLEGGYIQTVVGDGEDGRPSLMASRKPCEDVIILTEKGSSTVSVMDDLMGELLG